MKKKPNEILSAALKSIAFYINNFRPPEAEGLRAQLGVITEIALGAVEEAEKAAKEAA